MDLNAKKTRERHIFDLVYGDQLFEEVLDSERPDFLVRHSHQDRYFGVEITEFYYSETNARLDRVSGYALELLNGKDFKHKDDRHSLDVGKVNIFTKDNKLKAKGVPAVIKQVPSTLECARKVADVIVDKAQRLGSKISDLLHANLIIHDKTLLLREIAKQDFFRVYFVAELRAALSETPFREIFFVSSINKELGFIPLKMLQLMSEAYFFNAVFVQQQYANRVTPEMDDVELFASYFDSTVKAQVLVSPDPAGKEVIYGDTGILIGFDKSVTVRLHSDHPMPGNARPAQLNWRAVLDNDFHDAMNDFRKCNTFVMEILFPVK